MIRLIILSILIWFSAIFESGVNTPSTPTPEIQSTRHRVLIVLGQSNALGSAPDCKKPDMPLGLYYLRTPAPRSFMYEIDAGEMQVLELGVNTSNPRNGEPFNLTNFGIEVNYNYLANETFPDTFNNYVLKWAFGGQPIETFLPSSLGGNGDAITQYIIDGLNAVSTDSNDYSAALYYDQGEQDCANGDANLYEDRLISLINYYRDTLQMRNLPVIIRQMIRGTAWYQVDVLIQAQKNVADSLDNVFLLPADDLPMGDIAHLTANAQAILAERALNITKTLFD